MRTVACPPGFLGGKTIKAGRYTFSTRDPYNAKSPLVASGLLGPVEAHARGRTPAITSGRQPLKRVGLWRCIGRSFCLPDSILAKELGVATTPVREAVAQLASEGIVDLVPRLGAVVRPLSATAA